jgi:hypothetical protein
MPNGETGELIDDMDTFLMGAHAAYDCDEHADAHSFATAAAVIARAYGAHTTAARAATLARDAWSRMTDDERSEDRTPSLLLARSYAKWGGSARGESRARNDLRPWLMGK